MAADKDVQRVRDLATADHGLAVIVTQGRDGLPQTSVVNAGLMRHPVSGDLCVELVARGNAVKLRNLREIPRATAVFRAGWRWVAVEGETDLFGPFDPLPGMEPEALPGLLRDVFMAAGGTHDNWEEYDRVMVREERTAVFISLDRIYPAS